VFAARQKGKPRMSKILVVEDEGIIARDIQRTLIALGYEVPKIADSGEAALAAVEQINPDLVLMDIKLKGNVDGIETTARLRSRWDIPVIYLTAHSDDTTLARAKATGPHGYLLKPFNERDLRTAIEVALHKHEVERKLAEREHWFSTTLDSIGDAIIATNSHGGITYMNPVAETLTGWSRSEAQNQPLGEVFRLVDEHGSAVGGQDSLPLRPQFHVLVPATTRLYGRHGKRLEVDDSSAAIVDERGKNLGGVVVFRDITERRRMERRLMLAERLASIGTMAAGTAHEINNPLAAIVGNVGFANERAERVLRRLTELPAAEPLVRELR
jgi:two-component system cell cycle sensor histidine kinase/response regulator CckA